ncbi:MAG TPA: response regulator [Thermodesulfobacteriota bacterium]|jgi:CheY-like chemotaxis protein|nr:response regulator [Thermodesulfobacteriota bacterium]
MNEVEKIEAYLSSVRHDLRSQLMVVREGTSMILDGLGDSKCENCFTLLRPALECTDELNKLIGELLTISRFNAMLVSQTTAKEEKPNPGKTEPPEDELAIMKDELRNELEIMKDEVMGMISHVIRTPLAVLKESLSLVLDEIPGKLNPKQKELLSTGKQNLDGLIQSVEEISEKSWNEIVHPTRDNFVPEPVAEKKTSTTKKRILIVEDQAAIIHMLRMRLEANNYDVITAGDGQEGLEKAHKENPSLIILDIMLPKMNGYKVCQLLKADPKYNTIPIIISSGRTPQEIRKVGREVGADAYVSKPFEAEALLSKIKELLEKKGK